MKIKWSIDRDQENADWLKRDWIYPDNLEDLRKYLAEHRIDVADFKRTMRYRVNVGARPWLREL